MTLYGLSSAAAATRRRHLLPNGTAYWKSAFIAPDRDAPGQRPTGFLVEQEGPSEILPHFHQANQFQVFVDGTGFLGKHEIAPVTVHYTNAHSPYGPILSGETGLHYYTLRDDFDPGARFLPGALPELRKGRRRYATSAPPDPAEIATVSRTVMIPFEADGLGAVRVDAPAGETITAAIGLQVNDRFLLVLAGGVEVGGQGLTAGSCLFMGRDDEDPGVVAAPGGASLVIMQFPTHDPGISRPPG